MRLNVKSGTTCTVCAWPCPQTLANHTCVDHYFDISKVPIYNNEHRLENIRKKACTDYLLCHRPYLKWELLYIHWNLAKWNSSHPNGLIASPLPLNPITWDLNLQDFTHFKVRIRIHLIMLLIILSYMHIYNW